MQKKLKVNGRKSNIGAITERTKQDLEKLLRCLRKCHNCDKKIISINMLNAIYHELKSGKSLQYIKNKTRYFRQFETDINNAGQDIFNNLSELNHSSQDERWILSIVILEAAFYDYKILDERNYEKIIVEYGLDNNKLRDKKEIHKLLKLLKKECKSVLRDIEAYFSFLEDSVM